MAAHTRVAPLLLVGSWLGLSISLCGVGGCGGGDTESTPPEGDSATDTTISETIGESDADVSPDANDAPPIDVAPDTTPPSSRCAPLPLTGKVVDVSDPTKLVSAVYDAKEGDTIALADGTYDLKGSTLQLHTKGVTLRGKSGDREKVVIDSGYSTAAGDGIAISASNVTVAHLTVRRAYDHPIHFYPTDTADVTDALVYDVHVVDPGQQAIKINTNGAKTHVVDKGTIACSRIELTDAGRTKIRDSCYTGGIDAHDAAGWRIRDNSIEGFWCTTGLSEHGIHLWTGSRDTIVERNEIKDCARGIGLGLGDLGGRTYSDKPCGGATAVGHFGGIVRNNFVFAQSAPLFSSPSGFDVGIGLEQACEVNVLHNTVFSTTAPKSSSIEWRFANTKATLTNNLVSHNLLDRDSGATATLAGNKDKATASLFVDASKGDLHLASPATGAKDVGVAIAAGLCDDDIDATSRKDPRDVGADEL